MTHYIKFKQGKSRTKDIALLQKYGVTALPRIEFKMQNKDNLSIYQIVADNYDWIDEFFKLATSAERLPEDMLQKMKEEDLA